MKSTNSRWIGSRETRRIFQHWFHRERLAKRASLADTETIIDRPVPYRLSQILRR